MPRISFTKSLVSYPLSAASVMRSIPSTRSAMIRAACRSARPLHCSNAVHHDPISILDQHVAAIRQLRFMTTTLARQSCVRVRCGLVRLIAARFAVEVYRRIAGLIWRRPRPTLPLKTLLTRPGFDEGSVHAEVLVRD